LNFFPSYYLKLYCTLACPLSPFLLLLYNSLFILATCNYCVCFPPTPNIFLPFYIHPLSFISVLFSFSLLVLFRLDN
jgi:hypothetical protein